MRNLNRIIFINSANIPYADDIYLDGNIHFIGTQGVGKSTILRAILFFYNADKLHLGIPKEKQGELFKRFMQSNFSSDSIGIGLHLTHELVSVHKGSISYQENNGGGSIFTFEVRGGVKEAQTFIDSLQIFSLLANVADVKSLVIHPATTTHSQLSARELEEQGIKPGTVRLSIGTEHIDDLLDDLSQAFDRI